MSAERKDDDSHDIYMDFARLVIKAMLARRDGYIDFNVDDIEDIEAYSQIIAVHTSKLFESTLSHYADRIAEEITGD